MKHLMMHLNVIAMAKQLQFNLRVESFHGYKARHSNEI